MRILHLNQYGSCVGGGEAYISDVTEALEKAGHSSHLVYFSPDDIGDLISYTTFAPLAPLPKWRYAPTEAVRVLEKVIADFRPDVAYVHMVYHPALVNWIAWRLPTVAYVHGPFVVCPGYAQYLRRTSRVCPHKAGLICLFNAQVEKCCFGHSPLTHLNRLVHVVSCIKAYRTLPILVGSTFMQQLLHRNGIPLEHISILPPVLLNDVGSEPVSDSRRILFVGRLRREKGLRQLIEAVAPLSVEWDLCVAGEGEEQEACQNLAKRLNVAHRVHFLGWLSRSEMKSLYRRCALVVVPSLWPEPFGRVGPEAFVYGLPVVAFGVGGVVDWLDDRVTGYVVSPGDVVQLGHRIQTLLESPALRAQMARNARAKALELWSVDQHVASLMRTFTQVCAGPRAT